MNTIVGERIKSSIVFVFRYWIFCTLCHGQRTEGDIIIEHTEKKEECLKRLFEGGGRKEDAHNGVDFAPRITRFQAACHPANQQQEEVQHRHHNHTRMAYRMAQPVA